MDIDTNQNGSPVLAYETLDHFHSPWPVSVPLFGSNGAACFDVAAAIKTTATIRPQCRLVVPTGLKFKIPAGYELQVRSRSGLAAKAGIFVLNSPGTIDEDYQGELLIILANSSSESFVIGRGNRIAQVSIQKVIKPTLVENRTGDLFAEGTDRGDRGLGSTGS